MEDNIVVVFVNECAPMNDQDDFYGKEDGEYANSVKALFKGTSLEGKEMIQLKELGFYFTNVCKKPKSETNITKELLQRYADQLEEELKQFPNVKVYMLMGDTAIQTYTYLNRKHKKKRVIPAGSTYKLRKDRYMDGEIRVFPSYIMTGKNLKIEKSKITMIREDIQRMLKYLNF
ncbi:uracil-DNA glycosylase family protein [[Eubacterium] hominis]|uniref:uracil-DNA glycosylase family protein n=1 Tax=[Eubacterium] hominis TaxID=2764325 RepID=UPI003A4D4007